MVRQAHTTYNPPALRPDFLYARPPTNEAQMHWHTHSDASQHIDASALQGFSRRPQAQSVPHTHTHKLVSTNRTSSKTLHHATTQGQTRIQGIQGEPHKRLTGWKALAN